MQVKSFESNNIGTNLTVLKTKIGSTSYVPGTGVSPDLIKIGVPSLDTVQNPAPNANQNVNIPAPLVAELSFKPNMLFMLLVVLGIWYVWKYC